MSSLKELKPFVRMHLQSLVAIYITFNTIIEGYINTLLQLKLNLENALQENKSNDVEEISKSIKATEFNLTKAILSRDSDVVAKYMATKSLLDRDLATAIAKRNSASERKIKQQIQVWENCYKLFKKDEKNEYFIDSVLPDILKELDGNINSQNIASSLLENFSSKLLGDNKRTYDMSTLATSRNIPNTVNSQGQIVPDVHFEDSPKKVVKISETEQLEKLPTFTIKDPNGNAIIITLLGRLYYNDGAVPDEYIYKYRISKDIDGTISEHEVFSELTIFSLSSNPELCRVVAAELLSDRNIELSNADGYIGNIKTIKNSKLDIGSEDKSDPYYQYRINQKYLLEYDGHKIEAIRAFEKRQSLEKQPIKPLKLLDYGPEI